MSPSIRTLTVCTVGMLTLSACATRGALRHGLEEERTARIAADSAQRYDIASLRTTSPRLRADLHEPAHRVRREDRRGGRGPPVRHAGALRVRRRDRARRRQAALDRFASVVPKYYPGSKVTVEGFADPAGRAQYNLALSQRRAEAVRSYIASQGLTVARQRGGLRQDPPRQPERLARTCPAPSSIAAWCS